MTAFLGMIESLPDDFNCIIASEAQLIVADVRKTRMPNAISLLDLVGCPHLSLKLRHRLETNSFIPDSSWLKTACQKVGVFVPKPEELR
jgi:hypothetical protein